MFSFDDNPLSRLKTVKKDWNVKVCCRRGNRGNYCVLPPSLSFSRVVLFQWAFQMYFLQKQKNRRHRSNFYFPEQLETQDPLVLPVHSARGRRVTRTGWFSETHLFVPRSQGWKQFYSQPSHPRCSSVCMFLRFATLYENFLGLYYTITPLPSVDLERNLNKGINPLWPTDSNTAQCPQPPLKIPE